MPMFDYRCRNCEHVFEELVASSSVPDEEIECPRCKQRQSERLLSAPMISVGRSSDGCPAYSPSNPNCNAANGFT